MVPPALRPRSIAGRGGVSWCHLLLLDLAQDGALECAVTGAHVPLTAELDSSYCRTITCPSPCEGNLVKWISLSTRPSRTDRWLSERLNSYLSSRCLIGRDYTLLEKRVKQEQLNYNWLSK